MSRVLVTGANGFLGLWLTRKLQSLGHEVFALVRNPQKEPELLKLGCEVIQGDVTQIDSLRKTFKGMDAVFHLAGVIAYKKSERELMEAVNVQGTDNVVQACLENNVQRLIFVSSVVAVGAGFTPDQILNEKSDFNLSKFNFGYFETKKRAEALVLDAVKNKNLNAVMVNPSTIYGAGDMQKGSRKTQAKVALGQFPFYTSGGVSIVAVEDVVEGIIAAWERGRAGERYILSGENIRIQKLFELIAQFSGVKPPRFYLPNFVLYMLGHIGDFLNLFGVKSSLSYENAKVATLYHWFDHSKATKELDFNPRPASEAIKASVEWFKKHK